MNIPNKALQDKILRGYLNDRLAKLKLIAEDPSNPKSEFAKQELEEIAKNLGVSETDVLVAVESTYDPVSLYTPIYNDGGDTIYLYEQVEDKNANVDIANKMAIKNAINSLSKRERSILNNRYIIGKTQMEISEELGISQAQVSRIESNAINVLKKILK